MNVTIINYTSGTLTHADYTTPGTDNYKSSEEIMQSVLSFEQTEGLNGFLLISHIGTYPDRADKFYSRLDELITALITKGYRFESLEGVLP